jgi:hypothetical protein
MNEPGRNDPCPCGSGKKYKKCCLLTKPKPYADLEADFALGQRLIEEYNEAQLRSFLDVSQSYSPFDDPPEYHESFA